MMQRNRLAFSRAEARKNVRKKLRILGATALVAGLTVFTAAASPPTNWTNAGAGDWFTAGNWDMGVPTSSVDAVVDNGGTPTISAAGANAVDVLLGLTNTGNLEVNMTGTLYLTNIFVGDSMTGVMTLNNSAQVSDTNGEIGFASGSSGTVMMNGTTTWTNFSLIVGVGGTGSLTVAGSAAVSSSAGFIGLNSTASGMVEIDGSTGTAKWTNTGILTVGYDGNATLKVINGGTLSNTNDAYIARNTGSVGTATVDGMGSTWMNNGSIFVGNKGSGSLTVSGGGTVSDFDGLVGSGTGSGMVTVDGAGSKWTSSNFLDVGENSTGNTLTIKNGGVVQNVDGYVGDHPGSMGTVTIDGTGGASMWMNTGDLTVGNQGNGSVTVQNAASLSSVNGIIGNLSGSVGQVTVDANGGAATSWAIGHNLTVGNVGAGTLNIKGGGLVHDETGYVAYDSASISVVDVKAGSTWNNDLDLYLGYGGTGTLTIETMGKVINDLGLMANLTGSMATATVDGSGSLWTNNNNLIVGGGGTAMLTVQNAGKVTSDFGFIGGDSGGVGTATVTGAGSQWSVTNTMFVGEDGMGTLNIQAGGNVTNVNGSIGDNSDGTGIVNVDGAGSTWTNTGSLTVGNSGNGTMNVTNGGVVTSNNGTIASAVNSMGMVTVDGTGSMWTMSGAGNNLLVGLSGTATVDITNGGAVSNANGTVAYNNGSAGTVNVDGAGSTWTNGEMAIGYQGLGALHITNGGSVTGGDATIGSFAGSDGSTVTVDGMGSNWTLTGTLAVGDVGNASMSITNGGAVSNTTGYIARSILSTASMVSVDGANSMWTNSGGLFVGEAGNGSMSVTNGGTVSNTFGEIGDTSGAVGMVTVDGAGSTWTNSGDLEVGAHGGNGTLLVENGGAVSNTDAEIGHDATSTGMATVDGMGSTWTNSADLNVGFSGNGTLLVQNGGHVSSMEGFIGTNAGSTGMATIDGSGSKWDMGGTLFEVGEDGQGTLFIQNGGNVTDGTAIIGGSNTATGMATVDGAGSTWTNSGDLIVAKDGATGTLTIQNAGVVSDVNGFISINTNTSGTVIVDGAGSIWNNSANIYVGGDSGGPAGTGLLRLINGGEAQAVSTTVWSPGTLEVGSSYALNSALTFDGGTLRTIEATDFTNNATLASGGVNVDSDGFVSTVSGQFGGPGGLTKIGNGTIILTNNNTYTGDTNINAGTLQLDGSITSNTFVNPSATLTGIGTISGNLTNSGTVSPGDSPGTLTVTGNYVQNSNGNLVIEIASLGSHDLLQMGGTASLDGNLELVKLANFTMHPGDKVIFLTAAGGVSGQFATVTNPFGPTGTLINPEVIYEPTDVALLFMQLSFVLPGLTPNQQSVAQNLDKAAGDPRADNLIFFLDSEPIANLPHDYDLIAPEELASIYEIGFSQSVVQNDNLQRRMDDIRAGSNGFCANGFAPQVAGNIYSKDSDGKEVLQKNPAPVFVPCPENRWGVFVTGTGDFVNVGNDDDNAPGYDITTGNFTVGADYRFGEHFAVGIDGGYASSTADLVNDGRVDVTGGNFGAYATAYGNGFFGSKIYVDAAGSGAWNNYDTRRTGLQDTLVRGSTDGNEVNALLAYGAEWTFGCLNVGTWSTLQYTRININSFTEEGSLAPLEYPDQNEDSIRTTTGMRASYDFHFGRCGIVRPELRAAWQHEYGDQAYPIDSRLASGAGDIFQVWGPSIGRDAALVGAGVSVQWNSRFATSIYYDGVLGRTNYNNNAVSGGFRVSF